MQENPIVEGGDTLLRVNPAGIANLQIGPVTGSDTNQPATKIVFCVVAFF